MIHFTVEKGVFSYQRGGSLIAIVVDHLRSDLNWWVDGSKFWQTEALAILPVLGTIFVDEVKTSW